ncbi:MAG TPA: hypothetical protein VJY83_09990 [Thiopseudomonas sp.]|nr:hypothetical protein [Thiopseudomonas sp.]
MLNSIRKSALYLATIGIALLLATGSAFADRYYSGDRDHYRGDKEYRYDRKHEQKYRNQYRNQHYQNQNRRNYNDRYGFRHEDRRVINEYYSHKKYRNNCPPGLTKKNNRCQPYGKAKHWKKGQKLAKNTRYYDLPRGLNSQIYQQPNHRYVRVNDDVLMVDNITNIIIDVLENILR